MPLSSPEDYYLLYVIKGELEVDLPEGARSILLFPPRFSYRYTCHAKDPLHYLWVHFTGSYAKALLEECGLSPLPFSRELGKERPVGEQFRKLPAITETVSPRLRPELACALEQLILLVARAVTIPHHRPLERSLSFLHSSFREDIRIPRLAAMENLSHSRYITLFRQQMGVSPTAYLIGLRMERASEPLLNTDMCVKQIGILVGYEDPQFFSKLFKKHVGQSPTQYRKVF